LDDHAARTLLQVKGKQYLLDEASNTMLLEYEEAEAEKISDFAASMAWRASVSSQAFFGRVSLGPYESVIARALKGDPDARGRIDVFMAEFDRKDFGFGNPYSTRFDGVKFLLIQANRFLFYLKIDQRRTPQYLQPSLLRKGAPVLSLVLEWRGSKQAMAMMDLVQKAPVLAWFREAGKRLKGA
jgi:hypothetical protein